MLKFRLKFSLVFHLDQQTPS